MVEGKEREQKGSKKGMKRVRGETVEGKERVRRKLKCDTYDKKGKCGNWRKGRGKKSNE